MQRVVRGLLPIRRQIQERRTVEDTPEPPAAGLAPEKQHSPRHPQVISEAQDAVLFRRLVILKNARPVQEHALPTRPDDKHHQGRAQPGNHARDASAIAVVHQLRWHHQGRNHGHSNARQEGLPRAVVHQQRTHVHKVRRVTAVRPEAVDPLDLPGVAVPVADPAEDAAQELQRNVGGDGADRRAGQRLHRERLGRPKLAADRRLARARVGRRGLPDRRPVGDLWR